MEIINKDGGFGKKEIVSFMDAKFFLANLPKEDGAPKLHKQLLCYKEKRLL